MRKYSFLFLYSLFLHQYLNAQSVGAAPSQFVRIEPPASQTQIFNDVKKYGYNSDGTLRVDVNGSPFWSDEWRRAQLFDNRDSSYGIYPVKLNFAEGTIYFKNRNNAEMVINEGMVNKIIMYDTIMGNKIIAVFRCNIADLEAIKKKKNILVQEMNTGNTRLLIQTRRQIETRDSLFGTLKVFYYKDQYEYFIEKGNRVSQLKKLNKIDFLAMLPSSSKYKDWINENKLKFNKERDFIEFLTYYNSQEQAK